MHDGERPPGRGADALGPGCARCGHSYEDHNGDPEGGCRRCSCEWWVDLEDRVRKLVAMASGDWSDPDQQPEGEPPGSCDWGDCEAPAEYWRWSDDHGGWLPVCDWHDLNDV